ncbi:hypothetical protein SAY87_000784 [Trapa incisa]|uniref:NAC domain-containing protein n=1 Tax=Trapa incisa TaxID=236973 RepID=A0AAN7GF30_9MYRT|nr:hypothetical protein SAY87_000784 [Trapa incisa]
MDIPHIPGLDFHPTDDELLTYYLKQRIIDYFNDQSPSLHSHTVPDIDLCNMHPKELPRHFRSLASVKSNGREWVFFCVRKEKYRKSSRSDRTVPNIGHWKITSKAKDVRSEDTGKMIGTRNILTFHEGSHPKGIKTDWILHEYSLNASCLDYGYGVKEMPFVVCRLFYKGSNPLDRSTYETYGTAYQHTLALENINDQDMWPLSPIQQLSPISSDHSYRYYYNEEASSSPFVGLYNGGNSSNFTYPYPYGEESSNYLYGGGGGSCWN